MSTEKEPGLESLIYKNSKVSWAVKSFVLKDSNTLNKLYTYGLASTLIVFMIYSYFSSISITVDATGQTKYLNPEIPLISVVPFKVKEIAVKNNDSVKEGQILLRSTQYLYEDNYKTLETFLTKTINSIENETKNKCNSQCISELGKEINSSSFNSITNQVEPSLKVLLQKLRAEVDSYLAVTKTKEQFPQTIRALKLQIKSVNQKINKIRRRNAVKLLAVEFNELKSQKNKLESQISQKEIDFTNRITSQRNQLTNLTRNIQDELKTYNDKHVIKSTHTGKVIFTSLKGTEQIIQAGTSPVSILPKTNKLIAELLVQDTDIAKIKKDKEVKYDIQSLPASEFGVFSGKVDSIPLKRTGEKSNGQFRVISKISINDTNKDFLKKLKQGMKLKAKIIIGHENLLEYLWKRVLKLKDEATGSL